jgi:nitrous oxidase accessory protein
MGRSLQIIAVFLLLPVLLSAKTWRVGSRALPTIREALNLAAPGDTVLVESGTYKEKNLLISKPVYLKGIGTPVLDGEGQYEIISVKSDGVTIEGFLLRNSGFSSWNDIAGIKIYNARRVTIRSNRLENTYFGIFSLNSVNCSIINNQLQSNAIDDIQSGNGIHCWKCDSMQITGNTITRHRDGIYFEFVTNSLIQQNRSFDNARYGLHFMFSHNDTYKNNVFGNNGSGVSVMFSHGVSMLSNTFRDNRGGSAYGILMKEISDSRAEGNHFSGNTCGIYMEGTTRITVTKNTFRGNGWAMKIQASCADITVERNNFMGNTFDMATNGSLVLNTFSHNYWDKYEGYDLNRDGTGDVPYHPVSMYSMIAEKNPTTMMLFRSFMVSLLDQAEKIIPSITPEALRDDHPLMKPLAL